MYNLRTLKKWFFHLQTFRPPQWLNISWRVRFTSRARFGGLVCGLKYSFSRSVGKERGSDLHGTGWGALASTPEWADGSTYRQTSPGGWQRDPANEASCTGLHCNPYQLYSLPGRSSRLVGLWKPFSLSTHDRAPSAVCSAETQSRCSWSGVCGWWHSRSVRRTARPSPTWREKLGPGNWIWCHECGHTYRGADTQRALHRIQ